MENFKFITDMNSEEARTFLLKVKVTVILIYRDISILIHY